MKKKTYDIPAYKVGIIKITNGIEAKYSVDDYIDAEKDGNVMIIPFEDVDGLEVQEVQQLIKTEELMVQFYYGYTAWRINNSTSTTYETYKNVRNNQTGLSSGRFTLFLYIDEETLEKNKTTPVDQVVEHLLEDFYTDLTDAEKKCACCFFERYQDKDYKVTNQRVKKLIENNNQEK